MGESEGIPQMQLLSPFPGRMGVMGTIESVFVACQVHERSVWQRYRPVADKQRRAGILPLCSSGRSKQPGCARSYWSGTASRMLVAVILSVLHVLKVVYVAARPGHQPPVADVGTCYEDTVGLHYRNCELLLEQELGVLPSDLGHRLY